MALKAAVSQAVGAGCDGMCGGQEEPGTYLGLTLRRLWKGETRAEVGRQVY